MSNVVKNPNLERNYEPCVVSFIDILGFRNLVETKTANDVFEIISGLEKFAQPDDYTPPRKMKEARYSSRAFAQSVSDAIVRVRPYDTQISDGALFLEIYDLLLAQIDLIGEGVLIRAGVTVGEAYLGLHGEGPIFGPAMIRAFEIESQEAIFPRVVIDDHAIAEYQSDPRLRSQSHTTEFGFDEINSLLAIGDDGTRYIDYLRAAEGNLDDPGLYFDFLDRHATILRSNLQLKLDRRTKRKFIWLMKYHNSVVDEWRERTGKSEEFRQFFQTKYGHNFLERVAELYVNFPH